MTPLWTAATLSDLSWLAHDITTRGGGTSAAPFDTLNLGLHVGDDPARVRENRARAAAALGFSLDAVVCAEQVHGANVAVVRPTDAGRGAAVFADALPGVDALVTDAPGVLLALFYADCLPVLLADPERRVVGVAHAGWRGLVGGVIENTVAAMRDAYGTNPADLRAALGPCIGACCFAVGPEVAARFPAAMVRPPATPGANPRVDLAADTVRRLDAAGVADARLSVCGECTACSDPARWFSHRRDAGKTGRMGALIGIR